MLFAPLRKAIVRANRGGVRPKLQTKGQRRLFIDLAIVRRHDAGTGIQRVVRGLALALGAQAGEDWDIRYVAADRHNAYHEIAWPAGAAGRQRRPLEARPGDVFFGLDFSLDTVRRYKRQLRQFRRDGGELWFLVCDLLPVDRSDWFSRGNALRYKAWLDTIASVANGFFCISPQTDDDLRRVLKERYNLDSGFSSVVIPMGYAIAESIAAPGQDVAIDDARLDRSTPYHLMVGTLEPRKGHADVLDAFDALWQNGSTERLVIVGRQGWQVDRLVARIRKHPQHGQTLHWFSDVSDDELETIYRDAAGVIVGSHAEGFGLPLIEALGHRKPVLARDLSVFRLHEDRGVTFFPADAKAADLARTVQQWSAKVHARQIVVDPPTADWRSSANAVLSAFLHRHPV